VTEEEREITKRSIDIWKQTAIELDRIKCEELRSMTEEDSAGVADQLCLPSPELWSRTDRARYSGLVEQQRLFSMLHVR
jgi:hypothetical protein